MLAGAAAWVVILNLDLLGLEQVSDLADQDMVLLEVQVGFRRPRRGDVGLDQIELEFYS